MDNFYQSLANVWHNLDVSPIFSKLPTKFLRQLPLQGSLLIKEEKLKVLNDWRKAGFYTLNSLLNDDGSWATLNFQNLGLQPQRRLSYNFNQIKIYMNKIRNEEDNEEFFPDIRYQFQPNNQKNPAIFPSSQKTLYQTVLSHTITRNPNVPESRPFGKIIFTSFYCYPTEKKDSDVSWRLIYNCLVTPQKLFKWKIIQHQNCPWCPEEDGNVLHMIFHCKCTKALWISASKKMNQINGTNKKLTSDQALCGFQPNTPNHRLSNFILNLAKSTIYKTYSRLIKEDNPREPSYKTIFETRIKFRITLEEHKSNLYKTREKFRETFPIGNCLV